MGVHGIGCATGAALALAVLGPAVVERGYVLTGDMVFAPDPPWHAGYLGLDDRYPRSVPTDAVVWLFSSVLPGWLVQKAFLTLPVVLAVVGLHRLLSERPPAVRIAASVVMVWTPFVHDRLAVGQWSLLASWAALPWLVVGGRNFARAGRRHWGAVAVPIAAAAIFSPSGGLFAAIIAVAVVFVNHGRVLPVVALGIATNLPWLIPGLLASATAPSGTASVRAFAARAESDAGVLASLVSGGGIWKSSIVASERGQWIVVAAAAMVTIVAVAGAVLARDRTLTTLGLLSAGAAFGCVVAAAWPSGLAAVFDRLPATSVLRDTTRTLIVVPLFVAWGVAEYLYGATWSRTAALRLAGVVTAGVAPVLLLPSLAWGLLGDLRPTEFPREWAEVRTLLDRDPVHGPIVVLPWQGAYRRFPWNYRRAGLDPSSRYFSGDVVVDDRVFVGAEVLRSEAGYGSQPPRARIGAYVVERSTPGAPTQRQPGTLVHAGPELEVWRLDQGGTTPIRPWRATAVLAGDGVFAVVVGGAASGAWRAARRRETDL